MPIAIHATHRQSAVTAVVAARRPRYSRRQRAALLGLTVLLGLQACAHVACALVSGQFMGAAAAEAILFGAATAICAFALTQARQ